jgi:hypothetical protein
VPAEVAGFLRDDPPAGQSLGALMVAGIAGGGGGGADPLSDGTPGGALPTRTLWIAGADGTVLRGLQADATGRLRTVVEGTVAVANFPATQPVSGTVAISNPTANPETGLAKDVTLTTRLPAALNADGGLPTHVQNFPATQRQATQPVSLATNTPDVTDRAARLLGHVTVDNASIPVTGTFWQTTQPVSGTVTTTVTKPGTATQTSVASTVTTNTTLLAANANRLGASIYNESTSVLFILLGAGTESATVYTLQMAAGAYYEVPNAFTGIIKGHWVTANGSARVTELT